MNDSERLLALEEIKQLKARYFRFMDTKDWAGMRTVFTDDVVTDFRNSTEHYDERLLMTGADIYLKSLSAVLTGVTTTHHGHTPEIELTSETTAAGIWAMEDMLWVDASQSALPFSFMHGYGHYHETYRRVGGRWQIASTRLSRLKIERR